MKTPITKTPAETTTEAQAIWYAMTDNEKFGVKFGLFPNEPMQTATAEGHDNHTLAVALMDIASKAPVTVEVKTKRGRR